uniref:interferon-induced protein with tetratricopeptide repeats 1-like n=1 Tax=Monopterus albus TaxID=43700 RepID=UPI0009B31454|nr:interferon-induced protein with tetratricopeptide repeats 1-like [Monopterus albus]
MSAAKSQTPQSTLQALQCHFTWDLDPSRSKLFCLRDKLEDIGDDEANYWLGHIYNLLGYIHYQLGFINEARRLFSRVAEAFQQTRKADEGPWLVVNYGNQAWLHHHLGEEAESQAYLSKVDALLNKYPSPSQDELHPEVYAEKAWTLMKFEADQKLLAADYFQRAIRMQPDMVEWQTSYIIGSVNALNHSNTELDPDLFEKMRIAKEQDPENLYLAVLYLDQRAKKGEETADEAHELARKVLRNPVSSYSGIKPLLRLYRQPDTIDEATELAEEALGNHPDERFLKRCAALCYKWKVLFFRDSHLKQSMTDRAISLHKEVISLYPHSALLKKSDLASMYAKSYSGMVEADRIYQEMLQTVLEPADRQLLYNNYAKYLHFDRQDRQRSIKYHMKAAEMPYQTFYRQNSIKILQKIQERGWHQMYSEIKAFLDNLQEP